MFQQQRERGQRGGREGHGGIGLGSGCGGHAHHVTLIVIKNIKIK